MAPRAKAAAPKATTKKTAATATTGVKKAVKPAAKPAAKPSETKKTEAATNGASKKRKVEESEPESEVEAPEAKKSKTTREVKPVKKPAAKPTKAKAAPKKTKAEEPVKKSKVEEPKKPKAEKPKAEKPKAEKPKAAKPKATTPKPEAEETEVEETTPPPQPEAKPAPAKKVAVKKPEPTKKYVGIGRKINEAPTQILDVYVFGEGTSGELGLGSKRVEGKKPIDVKRPRLNNNLSAAEVGVVQVSCGGMHAVALTHDNKILTWGVNDQGALGRDTTWNGGLRDMEDDSDSDDDDDDSGVNPMESTPTAVSSHHFAPGTKFVQVVACDSATFALTEDGRVYGWGTFRSSDGILGFSETVKVQSTPAILPLLKGIKSLAAGSNHVLALDNKGNVAAWGCGQQNQLGRRIIERNKMSSLVPQGVGLPRGKIVKIACGSYHSFAIDKAGQVWGWGLNNFGEIGVESNAGEDDAVILRPAKITFLEDFTITDIDGGEHHSLACSGSGDLITWGRVDGYQVGFEFDKLTQENAIYDERGNARILFKPTVVPDIADIVAVTAGTDNNFAVTSEGKVYSWGFSSNYQTGQGTLDDIHTPTVIDNTAIRGKKILAAGAGGQYSILVGAASDAPKTNGVKTNGTHVDDDKENVKSKL
ncbi:regulator of chromosome condensation 1/beta-lactamase-inhibitor protein II [Ilyonectria robusta]|uniref:regulator of chromosome condensation 1/beta-lactamase-inhibitor protein II n=1 Tax=Ilyonectria robusta TaxID=1079257 RepID=UPI001E8CBD38|nr:regulator of chromosome condensation 1/beta-lactamase-inhibitor protein II [Ilyonectria robusta]KAH8729825.1 regulator of chromosome condensation 1/beta-lactamase-inhibitor protein II [Ilyonectria robusta]